MPDLTWGQLPRVPMLDARNIPVPESGYVGAGEVMERLLYAWWGASADEPSGYINDEPVGPGTPVGNVVASGHLYECTKVLVEAAGRGEIEGAVFVDGNMRVFPTAYWDNRTWQEWAGDFLDGILTHAPDGYPDWVDGQLLLFAREAVAEWICSLVSPHRLPTPLKRNPSALTNDPVTLSQALTWLSDGPPMEWWEFVSPSPEGAARMIADLKDPDVDSFAPSVWLAGYWTCKERETGAAAAVLSKLRAGEISAHGVKISGSGAARGGGSEVVEISKDYFLTAQRLSLAQNTIGPDADADRREQRLAIEAGTWGDVRFARHDLEYLWGSDSGDETAGEKDNHRAGRPVRNKPVLDAFDQLAPEGKTHDLTWAILAQRVSKIVGWKVSSEALQATVRRRDKPTKPT